MAFNILNKLFRADPHRRTRFHDHQGHFLPLQDIPIVPLRLVETVGVKCGRYPTQPWWPNSARRRIEQLVRPDWFVVEFGSGMSSSWLARRAQRLLSIEDNQEWFEKVSSRLAGQNLLNAKIEYRTIDTYLDIDIDRSPNMVVIDGQRRKDCIAWSMDMLKPGSFIYLDNSDRDDGPDSAGARAELLRLREMGKVSLSFFRGIPPGLFILAEGALAKRL